MLSLILVNEQIYGELRRRIIASQPAPRQQHLASCLDRLMADVQRNLEPKNRDRFTQVQAHLLHLPAKPHISGLHHKASTKCIMG